MKGFDLITSKYTGSILTLSQSEYAAPFMFVQSYYRYFRPYYDEDGFYLESLSRRKFSVNQYDLYP